jgi:hypothetical protein
MDKINPSEVETLTTEQKSNRIKPFELLKMLDLEERKTLAFEFNLRPPRNLRDSTFSKSISSFSVTTLLRSIIRMRLPIIHMLQEIHQFLEQQGTSGRANSQAVVLTSALNDLRIVFSSNMKRVIGIALADQTVSFPDVLDKQAEDLKDSITIFFQDIRSTTVRYEGEEYREARENPWLSSSRARLSRYLSIRQVYHPQDLADIQAYRKELQSFITKIEQIAYETIGKDQLLYQKTDMMLNHLRDSLETIDWKLHDIERHQPRPHDRHEPNPSIDQDDLKRLREKTQILQEDFFAVCNFQIAERPLCDFLRLSLWRERWRIYELWMLTHLLQLFADLGFEVDIQKRISNGCWDLKFTRDQQPIAFLKGEHKQLEIYYQLFSKELDKGNMPDIAVKVKDDNFLIVLDPKYGTSYTRTALAKTAKRYAQYFSPEITIIHNFYRVDSYEYEVISENPRCLVISDVHPHTTSVSRIDEEVRRLLSIKYLINKNSLVLLVDVSSSMCKIREIVVLAVKNEFQKLQNNNMLNGSLILFNDKIVRDLLLSQVSRIDELMDIFSGGTDLNRGIEVAIEKLKGMPVPRILLLFTDGQDTFNVESVGQRICLAEVQLKVYEITNSSTKTHLQELSRITKGEYEEIYKL